MCEVHRWLKLRTAVSFLQNVWDCSESWCGELQDSTLAGAPSFTTMMDINLSVNEPFLRDTINVPYYDGKTPNIPASDCGRIFATRIPSELLFIIAISWNTRTAG
jgi:hypothetical protein